MLYYNCSKEMGQTNLCGMIGESLEGLRNRLGTC